MEKKLFQLFVFLCLIFAGGNNVKAQCTLPGKPTVGTITQATCLVGGKVVLSALPSSGAYNILSNGTVVLSNQTGTSKTITGLSAGVYNFRFQNVATGCISGNSANVTISQPVLPTFTATATQPTCAVPSGKIVITAISGHTYSIDDGAFGTVRTFANLAPGTTHSVKVKKTSTGCESLAQTFTINSFSSAPAIAGDASVCRGNTIQFTTTPQVAGTWSMNAAVNGVSIDQNGIATVAATSTATTFTVKFTNSNNCSVTKAISIKALPTKPTVGAITQPNCTTSTGSVALSALPSTGSYNILSNGNVVLSNQTGATKTITGLSAGTYNFTVQNSTTGCTSLGSNTVVLNQAEAPTFTATLTQATCSVPTGTITVTPISGATYSFDNGASWQTSNVKSNLPAGNYLVKVKSASDCISASSSFSVNAVAGNVTPAFAQINPICAGENIVLPTTSNNGIAGTWSPSVNNQATTTYTFIPNAGQCALNATMTVVVNSANAPVFTPINPICAGENIVLPTTSNNGIVGTWSPSVNNQATTTYTFTPNAGQCASVSTMTVEVNPAAGLGLTSNNSNQTVDVNTTIQPIVYNLQNGASAVTVTGLPTGISYNVLNNVVTISGSSASTGSFNYAITTSGGCGIATANGAITVTTLRDWAKAPNSYIFDVASETGGLYIPIKKAYTMWANGEHMGGLAIQNGVMSADVYWEDTHGLIKSGQNYALEIVGSGENAKIKVPINKSLKGNAVIAFKIGGEIFWSWHVWVTDNPTNGSNYKSYDNVMRERKDGVIEVIPNSDWGWMDRNLGAISNSITKEGSYKGGGLLYQWGRKDPIPSLVTKGDDFYEVSGSIGRVRHRGAQNWDDGAVKIDNFTKLVLLANANPKDNIRLSVKNPFGIIYVNKNDNTGQAYYNNNLNLPINWFGVSTINNAQLNLWSDNSKGLITNTNYNFNSQARPYRNKSSYDPCPNGWRIPSALVANIGNYSYAADVRIDYSPFGPKNSMPSNTFIANNYHIIKPNDTNTPDFIKGIKLYQNSGFDLSNVGGFNMGQFSGTGAIARQFHGGQFSDNHHVGLWTATMQRWWDTTPPISAVALTMIPDRAQPDVPDPAMPTVKGRYVYYPNGGGETSAAGGCRCIKDPLFQVNEYDFPTEYFVAENVEYKEGISNPNSYQITKASSVSTIEIPVSKAFAVQSFVLKNNDILNANSYNNLKTNVLWTTNANLINNITLNNTSPSSLPALSNTKILVNVAPNQSGNAVVTLHNGSITNPVYWSWHIWVTDSPVSSLRYLTSEPNYAATNYINYTNKGDVLDTEFMDRNLGAIDSFPDVINPNAVSVEELSKINNSGGLHYQWGRKDPIPTFVNPNDSKYAIYLGNANTDGSLTYTPLNDATYDNLANNYIVKYDTYTNASNANLQTSDKIFDKASKVIGYSIKNPLVFMVPSNFSPRLGYNPKYTNGSDWLAKEPNVFAERWGRGNEKSPFDPCPEGWRIPDLSSVTLGNATYGTTPWYKKDISIQEDKSITSTYLGTKVVSGGKTLGYVFNNAAYKIGNYPNTGIRGLRGVMEGQQLTTFNVNKAAFGFWNTGLFANYMGRPISMQITFADDGVDNFMNAFHSNSDPYFGKNCRCVKVKYDTNGLEEGAMPSMQVPPFTNIIAPKSFSKEQLEQKVNANQLSVYPNPVHNILNIDSKEDKEYFYQVYNMSGQMVKQGKFENKKTDLSSLVSGVYLIRINNSETVVKIIKK